MSKLSYQRLLRARYSYLSGHSVAGKPQGDEGEVLQGLLQLPHPDRENAFVLWAEALTGPAIVTTSPEDALFEYH